MCTLFSFSVCYSSKNNSSILFMSVLLKDNFIEMHFVFSFSLVLFKRSLYCIRFQTNTVKPLNSGHFGSMEFAHYSEVLILSQALFRVKNVHIHKCWKFKKLPLNRDVRFQKCLIWRFYYINILDRFCLKFVFYRINFGSLIIIINDHS